jgi:hypothetical protein
MLTTEKLKLKRKNVKQNVTETEKTGTTTETAKN